MKRLMLVLPMVGIVLLLSACRWNHMPAEELYDCLDGIASEIAESQLTEDANLIGQRWVGEDNYAGTYTSDCTNAIGRDVVFGGASIKERRLRLTGSVQSSDGNAQIRVRMNDEILYVGCSESGAFDQILNFGSGGNFIMVDYDDFTGEIIMDCAYVD